MANKFKIIAGVLLATGLLMPPANVAAAQLPIVADTAVVNKTGGLTVSGTMSCADAVNDFDWSRFSGDANTPPANLTAALNVNWDAYQPVGRKTMLQAGYDSEHKDTCYNTNQKPPFGPSCGTDLTARCPWLTSSYNSTSLPFYIYSSAGKFAPGALHVDIKSADSDGWIIINGEIQCELPGVPKPINCADNQEATPITLNISQFSGFDLRATRLR